MHLLLLTAATLVTGMLHTCTVGAPVTCYDSPTATKVPSTMCGFSTNTMITDNGTKKPATTVIECP